MRQEVRLGAIYCGNERCRFRVWAPNVKQVELHILAPQDRLMPMLPDERGYHEAEVPDVEPGARYLYRLDGEKERPDPASRYQPEGVHGPSEVVDQSFPWEDECWFGLPLPDQIIYELHTGTFSAAGTFQGVIPYLDDLLDLGITSVELMPVAQFPGSRNWGYDGTYPFAVQNSYGGPSSLKTLVNACHCKGLAVIMDVVYNHLGPEGNYLWDYGPYFTDHYKTPWGSAVNFDGPFSDEVRCYFVENALYWVTEFHIDALRIDAVHAILDFSAQPFLEELGEAIHAQAEALNRRIQVIPESALNDTRIIRPRALGGFGLDAQWNDDFHHALRTILTGENQGYYQDFGRLRDLTKALREGYVYSGAHSAYRKRRHGNSSRSIPARRFVVFIQNHDQVGNRMLGERLSELASFEQLKLAAGAVLLSPFVPLLFMGEEYGERARFPYFISHTDAELVEAVQRGRREEFAAFGWEGEPPDPQAEVTFQQAKLDHSLKGRTGHRELRAFYRELIRLRRSMPALANLSKDEMEVLADEDRYLLAWRRWQDSDEAWAVFNFSEAVGTPAWNWPAGRWMKVLDSAEERWGGPGTSVPDLLDTESAGPLQIPPHAIVLFSRVRQ
jgi:maltooligosyltrehalose trehalohydrolase